MHIYGKVLEPAGCVGKFENPTPRQQITSMLQKVSKDEVNVERYDKKSTTYVDMTRSLFHWQTHAKIPDNVVEDGYFVVEVEQVLHLP